MIRGTTSTVQFHLENQDLNLDEVSEIWITIQGDKVIKTWDYSSGDVIIDVENKKILVTLTQEETLAFKPGKLYTQLRILFNDDRAFASKIMNLTIEDVLKGGEIS